MESKTPWFKKSGVIAILLFLFFPLGLFLMWKYSNWHIFLKGAITLIFVLLLIGGAASDKDNTPSAKAAIPSPTQTAPQPTKNAESAKKDLNAEIRFSDTAYMITNKDKVDWKDCKLEMNSGILHGGYTYMADVIMVRDPMIIPFREFTKSDGTRFSSYDTKPLNISISCADVGGNRGFGYFESK